MNSTQPKSSAQKLLEIILASARLIAIRAAFRMARWVGDLLVDEGFPRSMFAIKRALLAPFFANLGNNVRLCSRFELFLPERRNISIGKNTFVGRGCAFSNWAPITIGENCLIANNVQMLTATHNTTDFHDIAADIKVGGNCWIGAGTMLLAGVEIAPGCIVGAGSVVTRNTIADGIYAGIPARRIKDRTEAAPSAITEFPSNRETTASFKMQS